VFQPFISQGFASLDKEQSCMEFIASEADAIIRILALALAAGEMTEGAYAVWIEQTCRNA